MGSTLKGKKLLLSEQILPLSVDPVGKGDKNKCSHSSLRYQPFNSLYTVCVYSNSRNDGH